jgi:hypothetical protein
VDVAQPEEDPARPGLELLELLAREAAEGLFHIKKRIVQTLVDNTFSVTESPKTVCGVSFFTNSFILVLSSEVSGILIVIPA